MSVIRDLAVNETMDRDAMNEVRGGNTTFYNGRPLLFALTKDQKVDAISSGEAPEIGDKKVLNIWGG